MSKADADLRRRHETIYGGGSVPRFKFWRVAPGLLAGRNPLSEHDVRALRDEGVTHVLDLREETEWSGPGRLGREAVDSSAAMGIERLHVPIGDFSPPSEEAFTAAADWLDGRFAEPGASVFTHCRAGLQRTPTILAAWLARREEIDFDEAVARLGAEGYPGEPLPEQRRAAKRWLGRQVKTTDSPMLASRIRGCLLGGALGDALGAPIEFVSLREILERFGARGLDHFEPAYGLLGAITDDTQMTLFTAEGLIRAAVRWESRGICHPPSVVHHAYMRWLATQDEWRGGRARGGGGEEERKLDGWLIGERFLHARRAPGNTCLSALRAGGSFGTVAVNDSKGCGGVMRAAPVGFLAGLDRKEVFRMGVEIAALTHGHVTGQLPAGALAVAVHAIVHEGRDLSGALDEAAAELRGWTGHGETLAALEAARNVAGREGEPSAERVETLGGGWIAEEALAIAVYAALVHPGDVRAALVLAANHSGDSDSTAAICGNLIGALRGESALPAGWLEQLEGRAVIERLADDFVLQIRGEAPVLGEGAPPTPEAEAWFERYPGW